MNDLPEIPRQWVDGLIPTMNDKGFMFEVLDDYARAFISSAGESPDPCIEIGCAYGIVTLAALENGATITACDMDARHLEILDSRTPAEVRDRLTLTTGTLPEIDLPENHFGSLLCSRVLHFLPGDEVDASVRNMFRWLKPGGKLFLVADCPYGIWRNFIPTWEKNIANGVRWPGIMIPPIDYLPFDASDKAAGPALMNLFNPELLTRTATEAGFEIEQCEYIDRSDFGRLGRMDGRENCGLVATKPA